MKWEKDIVSKRTIAPRSMEAQSVDSKESIDPDCSRIVSDILLQGYANRPLYYCSCNHVAIWKIVVWPSIGVSKTQKAPKMEQNK